MTNEQIAASLDQLNTKLDNRFGSIEHELEKINLRLDQTVTKSDVTGLIVQTLAYTCGIVVPTFLVLSILGKIAI